MIIDVEPLSSMIMIMIQRT